MKKLIFNQINKITSSLIGTSFITNQNFPSDKENKIAWSGFKDISFALKNIPYINLYNECLKESAFNFILLDGAIIQLMYEFDGDKLIKHRLAFYPSPNVERYQDAVEDFEEVYFGSKLFADIFDSHVVVFPLRIDYDVDKNKYVEHNHSFAHLTLGNYKNCRVPVNKPFSPNKFILFILRSFYFDRFVQHYTIEDFKCLINFNEHLTQSEKSYFHVSH